MSKEQATTNTQEELETLQVALGLRLLDDNLMTLVFDRNIGATELLLKIILQRDDLRVLEVIAHREYKNPMVGGRSITIDIYAVDSNGKVYNVEVQRADQGADVHRARFHSSMVDSKMLEQGQDFKEINDSYVIFITENDVMKAGLPLYHVERVIEETGEVFNDGSHIIYVNGSYKNDEEPIGKLMHDFRCSSSVDMFYPLLAEQMRYFKETEGGREKLCKAVEELVEKRAVEAEAKGRAEAEAKAKEDMKKSAIAMLNDGIDIDKVSEYTKLPLSVVMELN